MGKEISKLEEMLKELPKLSADKKLEVKNILNTYLPKIDKHIKKAQKELEK